MKFPAIVAAAILAGAVPVRAVPPADEVLADVEKAMEPGDDVRATFEMTIANRSGEEVRWTGEYYRKSSDTLRKRFVFLDPLDIRGMEISVARSGSDDTIRIYHPSVRRTRTLRTDLADETFAGTDFTYDQLGFESIDDYEHETLDEKREPKSKRDAVRVRSRPKADSRIWYGKVVRWVDEETSLPLRTEYYDPAGELYQVRTLSGIEEIGGHWTATIQSMHTVQNGTWSRIRLRDVRYDTGLSDDLVTGGKR